MSTTPITDAVRLPINSHTLPADVVYAEFARTLERENAQLLGEVARLKGMASWAHTCVHHTDAEREQTGIRCPVCSSAQAKQSVKWALMERDRAEQDTRDINSAWTSYRSEWDEWKARIDAERDRALERADKAESALHNCEITLGLNMLRAEEAEALLCRVESVFEIVAPTVRRLVQVDCIAAFEKTHADVRAAINHES